MPSGPSADVIVAGAGIIGAGIAWKLAQAGLSVALFDAGRVGAEASTAGAGMLAPGGEVDRPSSWAGMAVESLRIYPSFVASLAGESGVPIGFRHCGAVEIAESEQEWNQLRDRAARQAALGLASQPLTAAQLRKAVPALRPDVPGGLFYPQDALVDPGDVMQALRTACANRGVAIHEGCKVLSVDSRASEVCAVTSSGPVAAAAAVVCAGPWSSSIAITVAGARRDIPPSFPIRGHLAGYSLEPGSLGPIVRHQHTYVLQRSSGFAVAGSSEERVGFDRAPDPRIVEDILHRARSLLPKLLAGPPSASWIGFRPATVGLQPAIGRLDASSIWLAYGHYRNGILMAPATAARVAGEIISSLGKDSLARGGSRG